MKHRAIITLLVLATTLVHAGAVAAQDCTGLQKLSLAGADTGITQINLNTLQGGLQLNGNGQWAAGKVRFRGEAHAAPGTEAALNNLLNIIGRRQGALSLISIG